MDLLTGTGLAASAGLNAYIPLLALGLLDRYSSLVDLGPGFAWLSEGWVLIVLALLLALELVADKIPAIDSVNDTVQTLVRPTAGGIVFGSSSVSGIVGLGTQEAAPASSPGTWLSIMVGIVIALIVHLLKAAARPIINSFSAGLGAPLTSSLEDATALALVLAAIFLPVLVLGFLIFFLGILAQLLLRRRARAKPPA